MLYAKIDVALARNERLLTAGPLARLLYVQAVLYARENLTDGRIPRIALPIVAIDIPTPAKLMRRLVETGALDETDGGWQIPAHVWRKWAPTAEQIHAKTEAKRSAGIRGNHNRWHTAKGITDPTCRYCDPNPIAQCDTNPIAPASRTDRHSSEPEPETLSQRPDRSDPTLDDDLAARERADEAIHILAKRDAANAGNTVRSPAAYLATCRRERRDAHYRELHALALRSPQMTPDALANAVELRDALEKANPEQPCALCGWDPTIDHRPHTQAHAEHLAADPAPPTLKVVK